MESKDRSVYLAALLGVILGVLLAVTVGKATGGKGRKVSYDNWQKLNVILKEVQDNYVDTVNVGKLTDAAVTAALAQLDPHSVYLPPQERQASDEELAGNFDGIGIQFNVPNDTAVVLEVIPGGPSEKVGLKQGDRLISIDDSTIAGVRFPQDSMVRRMKGPSGTKVKLTVNRDGELIPFEITRGKIPVHCIDAAFMIDDTTGYIRLAKFSRNTYAEMSDAAVKLSGEGMKKLIFDLRDNTGGYFDQALLLCDMFLGKGDEIVYLQGLHRKKENYTATGKGILKDIPVVVLINESTASSSEIFAGAIQDNDRGVIVGRRSFGKGLVQEPLYFSDGSGLRITVARFYTPSGRCIQKPYTADYGYDIYRRYSDGEMFAEDSIKVDSTAAYKTVGGRTVYGGGGIIPDLFVPVDTTRATKFYQDCNRKATAMRYASSVFDRYKGRLSGIDDFGTLEKFLSSINIAEDFKAFAYSRDGLRPSSGSEWDKTAPYLVPQLRALIGRYSKLGDNAFYKLYLATDQDVKAALSAPAVVRPQSSGSGKSPQII